MREVELMLVGVQGSEEVENLVEHRLGTLIRLIDLVDDHNGSEPDLQGLAEDELGLRHRPFRCIDKEQAAVDHRENALDLATEIRMTWRIDDVDPRVMPVARMCIWRES